MVADQGDAEAANQIRSLINDAPQFLYYLSSMASRKGTDVRPLLAKHVRMGYWN